MRLDICTIYFLDVVLNDMMLYALNKRYVYLTILVGAKKVIEIASPNKKIIQQ